MFSSFGRRKKGDKECEELNKKSKSLRTTNTQLVCSCASHLADDVIGVNQSSLRILTSRYTRFL